MQIHPYEDTKYVFMTKGQEIHQLQQLEAFLRAIAMRESYGPKVGPQANDDSEVRA